MKKPKEGLKSCDFCSFKLNRSKRKSISLIIDKNGDLIVKAPYIVEEKMILNFVLKKQDWIERKQNAIKASNNKYLIDYKNGNTVYYLGMQLTLKFCDVSKIRIEDSEILIPLSFKDNAKEKIIKWYKSEAKKQFLSRLEHLSAVFQEKYSSFMLSSATTRWGSCGYKGTINLNWRLMMCPLFVVDYVIIHELTHLKIKNHGKEFWTEVKKHIPGYKQCNKWLKDNQGLLKI